MPTFFSVVKNHSIFVSGHWSDFHQKPVKRPSHFPRCPVKQPPHIYWWPVKQHLVSFSGQWSTPPFLSLAIGHWSPPTTFVGVSKAAPPLSLVSNERALYFRCWPGKWTCHFFWWPVKQSPIYWPQFTGLQWNGTPFLWGASKANSFPLVANDSSATFLFMASKPAPHPSHCFPLKLPSIFFISH